VSIPPALRLLSLLWRFLWGSILRTLEDRAARIGEGLGAAGAARAERERMTEEVERLLAQARQQAGEIAERTTKAAEAAAAEIRTQAKTEADRTRQRAQVDAKQLHDQALAQL